MMGVSKWFSLIPHFFTTLCLTVTYALTPELSGKDSHKARFVTEPEYVTTYFTIENTPAPGDEVLLAPGYIFIDPVHGSLKIGIGGTQVGPEIREQDGTLVWYGGSRDGFGAHTNDDTRNLRVRVQDFHVCDYKGTTGSHLCWSNQVAGRRRRKVIVNQAYELVESLMASFEYDGGEEWSNMHEFNVVDHGTAYLMPGWPPRKWDLSELGGPKDGVVWDGCFKEVNIDSSNTTFQWCWLDHLPIWETNLFPMNGLNITGNITSPKVGDGTEASPYDAWHLNAIDKNEEGDYLVSVRHDDQILKIAGNNNTHGVQPGTILWRCGGRGSTVTNEGDFIFTKQHGVRYLSTTSDETVFSILDNAWEGALQPSSDSSSGMVISVNNDTNIARLLRRYPNPKGAVAPSQGSFQTLPNGNVFIGWGSRSQFSEFTEGGELLYHASYTNETTTADDLDTSHAYSYRLFKSPWVAKPIYPPKLVTYSQNCSGAALVAWVSWNGATEVAAWRFHISNNAKGPWFEAGTWDRTGFETEAYLGRDSIAASALQSVAFPRFVFVTALDASGSTIPYGEATTGTFVPRPNIRNKFCTETGCFAEKGFDYDLKLSCSETCAQSMVPQLMVLIILVVILETMDFLCTTLIGNRTEQQSWQKHRRAPSTLWDLGMQTAETAYAAVSTAGKMDVGGHTHGHDYKYPKSPAPPPYIEEATLGTRASVGTEQYRAMHGHARVDSMTSRPGFQRTTTPGHHLSGNER